MNNFSRRLESNKGAFSNALSFGQPSISKILHSIESDLKFRFQPDPYKYTCMLIPRYRVNCKLSMKYPKYFVNKHFAKLGLHSNLVKWNGA